MTQRSVPVLVLGQTLVFREALLVALASRDSVAVVATAGNCEAAMLAAAERRPEVAVVDAALDRSRDVVRALARRFPDLRIVVVGSSESEPEIIGCVAAGAFGYLGRDGSLDDLVTAIASAARGEAVCSPRVAVSLMRHVASLAGHAGDDHDEAGLTQRECQVADLLDEGLSNRQIADRLGISLATVKTHVHNILHKTGAYGRADAVLRARNRDA
jgi:two-component system nitrate/nitrite response regulator NarL